MLYDVTVTGLKKIFDLPDSWSDQDYRNLLIQLELEGVDEVSGTDLFDLLLMALQDMEPEDAADLVLAHKIQKLISSGSRQNIVQDLLGGQRPWEEASDISLHAKIFMAAMLLNQVSPKTFNKPDMMQLTLQLQCLKPESEEIFDREPEAAFLTRLLADGMDENSILERLFDKQLHSHSFPEADGIIWKSEFSNRHVQNGQSATLTIYSSRQWLDAMKDVTEFKSSAYCDRRKPADDDD